MKRLMSLLALILMLTSLTGTAGAHDHWANADASYVAVELGWVAPPDLDKPISPGEWNALVARLAGVEPGEAPQQEDDRRYRVWVYTAGMAQDRPVIARQHAIGGLMQLTYFLYQQEKFHEVAAELMVRNPDGQLRPEEPLTYAEAATLISRILHRYGKPVPPDPMRPAGFGRGLGRLPFTPEDILSNGTPRSEVNRTRVLVHGAAYAPALPGVGVPAPGHVWVLVDVQVTNMTSSDVALPGGLRISLADSFQVLYEYEADAKASGAIGSPFIAGPALWRAGRTMRGIVAFAVPAGTPGLWYKVESWAGQSPEKPIAAGAIRGPLGALPGPERIFPYGTGPRAGNARLVGVYERAADAAVLTAAVRADGMPAWIEAEPDGRYAAIVGVKAK